LRDVRIAARNTVLERYDMRRVALPAHVSLWEDVMGRRISWGPPRRERHQVAGN
jgi:hypothetical protein